jgi:hypothetical protein
MCPHASNDAEQTNERAQLVCTAYDCQLHGCYHELTYSRLPVVRLISDW